MSKKFFVVFGMLAALLVITGACTGTDTPAPGEPAATQPPAATSAPDVEPTDVPPDEPIILRVGGVKDTDCWNPWSCGQIYYFLGNYVNEPITYAGTEYRCEGKPLLVKSIDVSDDGKTQTWHLQEGVTFSDGTPWDAHAYVDYLDWIYATEGLDIWWNFTMYMTSYEALDDLTVQFTHDIPLVSFTTGNAMWYYIYPAHIWSEIGVDDLYTVDNWPPIGTGPFIVTEWAQGEYIIYDANENYWQGPPPIDRVVYQLYGTFDALIQAFLAGEVDVINNSPAIPPVYYDTLAAAEDTTVIDYPPAQTHNITFNLFDGGIKNPAIDDVIVRRAIDTAIDRQQLVDVSLLGHGIPCPTSWGCGPAVEGKVNPDRQPTPYDPEKARTMLEEAGYTDTDGDGVREGPDGTPMDFRLYFSEEDPLYLSMSDLIKGWLGEIGIAVDPIAMEIGTQFSVVLTERDYDMLLIGFTPEYSAAALEFYFACWAADSGAYAWNFSGICNPELDNLIYETLSAPNQEEVLAASYKVGDFLASELPRILLVGQNNMQVFHNNKFEFDTDICFSGAGVWDAQMLMNLEVK